MRKKIAVLNMDSGEVLEGEKRQAAGAGSQAKVL
jgi:hypothetical protein